jgi:predicted acyltransferase
LIGLGLIAAGWAADQYGLCPIVKRIWTPAWTLYSGGICFLMLAGFYIIADWLKQAWLFFPFVVIGANSIAAYCLAHGFDDFVRKSLKIHVGEAPFKLFGEAYQTNVLGAVTLGILWLILWWMYRNRYFVRI